MTEPSLSSDVKSMQADEVWQAIKVNQEWAETRGMQVDEHLRELEERVATTESTLAQWQATVWAKQIEERVAALEQHPGNPAAHPDLCTVASHLGVLKRLQALEELCAGCKEANELIESMPPPWEELG